MVNLVHFAATDIQRFKNPPKKTTDIVWVGRFHKQKGILDLPDILHEAKQSIPDISAVIVGGGNDKLKHEIEAKIKRLGLSGQITFAGFVTGEEKDRLISSARLFAMTSYFESYSIVILETMKLGTPMVSYDLPCHAPYRSGIDVVPMFDKSEFAAHIVKLLQDKKAYAALEANMTKKAQEFSWERTVNEFLTSLGVKAT